MQTHLIEGQDAFKALRSNWNELYKKDPSAQYFLSWQWLSRLYNRNTANLVILAARPSSSAPYVALFPLRIRTRYSQTGNFYYNDIIMAGNFAADYTGFLCDPEYDSAALPALGRHLAKMDWAQILLENLYCSEERLALLTGPLRQGAVRTTNPSRTNKRDNVNNLVCPVLELPETFDAYLDTCLSSNTRQKLRRFARKVKADPSYKFTIATPETVDRDIDILMGFWHTKWAARKGDKIDTLAATSRHMLKAASAARTLFLPVLWHEDRPLGALASFMDPVREALLFALAGRDESWTTPPPGLLLHGFSINWAINNGFKTYDFLRGNEPYKYSLGAQDRRIHCQLIETKSGRNRSGKLDKRSLPGVLKTTVRDYRSNRRQQALAGLNQVLATDPDYPQALYYYGQHQMAERDFKGAVQTFTRLTQNQPQNAQAWLRLGQSQYGQKDLIEAEVAVRQALLLEPANMAARSQLADTLLAMRHKQEATEAYQSVLALPPKTPAEHKLVQRATTALSRLRPVATAPILAAASPLSPNRLQQAQTGLHKPIIKTGRPPTRLN